MCKQTSAGVINDQRILCELPMQRSLTLMIQICLQRPQNLVLLHFYVSLTILEHLSSRSLIQRGRAQIVEKASTGTALLESGNFQLLFSLHSWLWSQAKSGLDLKESLTKRAKIWTRPYSIHSTHSSKTLLAPRLSISLQKCSSSSSSSPLVRFSSHWVSYRTSDWVLHWVFSSMLSSTEILWPNKNSPKKPKRLRVQSIHQTTTTGDTSSIV